MSYGIIYCIYNKNTGKMYIGQTVRTLKERFHEHKNAHKSLKTLIGRSIRKHGKDSFECYQLDFAESQDQLDYLELMYIAKYNTISPNGYNLRSGGREGGVGTGMMSPESRDKISKARRGIHEFMDPHGDVHITSNLHEFCDYYRLSYDGMLSVKTKKQSMHRGWTLPIPRPNKIRDFSGSKNPRHKISEENVLDIRKKHSEGYTPYELQALYPVISVCTMYNIINRRTWTHT